MDEVEGQLRRRLADSAGEVRSVVGARASGRWPAEDVRSTLREAMQRQESDQHALERYVHRHRRGASPWSSGSMTGNDGGVPP